MSSPATRCYVRPHGVFHKVFRSGAYRRAYAQTGKRSVNEDACLQVPRCGMWSLRANHRHGYCNSLSVSEKFFIAIFNFTNQIKIGATEVYENSRLALREHRGRWHWEPSVRFLFASRTGVHRWLPTFRGHLYSQQGWNNSLPNLFSIIYLASLDKPLLLPGGALKEQIAPRPNTNSQPPPVTD